MPRVMVVTAIRSQAENGYIIKESMKNYITRIYFQFSKNQAVKKRS